MDDNEPMARPQTPLDRLSVDELRARIEARKAEIAACEAELAKKEAHKSAADSLFGKKG